MYLLTGKKIRYKVI